MLGPFGLKMPESYKDSIYTYKWFNLYLIKVLKNGSTGSMESPCFVALWWYFLIELIRSGFYGLRGCRARE